MKENHACVTWYAKGTYITMWEKRKTWISPTCNFHVVGVIIRTRSVCWTQCNTNAKVKAMSVDTSLCINAGHKLALYKHTQYKKYIHIKSFLCWCVGGKVCVYLCYWSGSGELHKSLQLLFPVAHLFFMT